MYEENQILVFIIIIWRPVLALTLVLKVWSVTRVVACALVFCIFLSEIQ